MYVKHILVSALTRDNPGIPKGGVVILIQYICGILIFLNSTLMHQILHSTLQAKVMSASVCADASRAVLSEHAVQSGHPMS